MQNFVYNEIVRFMGRRRQIHPTVPALKFTNVSTSDILDKYLNRAVKCQRSRFYRMFSNIRHRWTFKHGLSNGGKVCIRMRAE